MRIMKIKWRERKLPWKRRLLCRILCCYLLNMCNEKNEEKLKKRVDWLFLFVSSFLIGSFFLASDWIINRKLRLLNGSISSDMIGWCYKTFQSSFGLNKFIFGPFRSCMRSPHPSRGSPMGDV